MFPELVTVKGPPALIALPFVPFAEIVPELIILPLPPVPLALIPLLPEIVPEFTMVPLSKLRPSPWTPPAPVAEMVPKLVTLAKKASIPVLLAEMEP